jgi:hypothetical protein
MVSTSRSEEDIRRALEKASQVILKRKPLPEMMFERVKDAILNKLCDTQNPLRETSGGNVLPKLSAEDSRDIASNLVIRDRKSPETLLHWTILNDFIEQLINQKIIHEQSKYLNVPQQIRRKLLTYVEKTNLENIAYISIVMKKLLSLETTLVFSSRDEEEIEYVCSYVASAVIFGKVLLHDFYSHLLTIRRKDFSLDPISVTLPLKGCENQEHGAFYRYFLPCSASIYLLRCILFYKRNAKELGIKNLSNPDGFIFEHFLPRLKKFPEIFRRWLGKKFESTGAKVTDDLTLNTFRRAVIDLTVFESVTTSDTLPSYPPFLISIQSGKIRSDSCVPSHFMLDPDQPGKPDYEFPRRSVKSIRDTTDSTLSRAFEVTYASFRHLTKESTLNERRIMAEDMRSTALKMKGELPSGAFENLRLATEFICRMIVIKKDNSKSKIRNQSIAVRNLILNLPHSIPIYDLTEEEIAKAVRRTAEHYKSDFI